MESKIKIIDNFLSKKEHKDIEKTITGFFFPWFYNDTIVYEDDPKNWFQFTHLFYNCYDDRKSNAFHLIEPIIKKIDPLVLLKVKANLQPLTKKIEEHSFHTDFENEEKVTTAIYYVNTNDGYTLFKTGEKVISVANRFTEFNNTQLHTGTTCTNTKVRLVINFNYIKKQKEDDNERQT